MLGPLTYLDAGLLGICMLSGLLAMYRGVTREVLSIVAWLAGAGAAVYVGLVKKDWAQQLASQLGTSVPIAQAASAVVAGLLALIIVHMLTIWISDNVLDSRVGMIDRLLGLFFGVVRGFVLVLIPFMFYQQFVPDEARHYDWVRKAKALPYLKNASNGLHSVLQGIKLPIGKDKEPSEPPTGQQQGSLPKPAWRQVAASWQRAGA